MRKQIILFLSALAIVFTSCQQEDFSEAPAPPRIAATSGILIEGDDAGVILENISQVRTNLSLIARSLVDLSQDEGFAERVAIPLRGGTKAGNFSQPIGDIISSEGTNATILPGYLESMQNSLAALNGTSSEVEALSDIAVSFAIGNDVVYPKLTVSIIGAREITEAEEQNEIDIRPEYIALSQSYSPGTLPAWQITEDGAVAVMVSPETIYDKNVWYIGIANVGPNGQNSGLTFRLLAQGEECSCTVAMSGYCIEEASNGTSKIKCGSTNTNCDCPNDCSGASSY